MILVSCGPSHWRRRLAVTPAVQALLLRAGADSPVASARPAAPFPDLMFDSNR